MKMAITTVDSCSRH